MKNGFLICALWLILPFFLVATCSRPPVEPVAAPVDSLALQHRLGRALDSLNTCGAPDGCSCIDGLLDCPDPKPEGIP
jgi:hypothetical protein